MKNFAAKLFLIVMAVTALSAAAVAKTVAYDSMVNYFTMASSGKSTGSSLGELTNGDLVNSFLGDEPTCYRMKVTKKGRKVYVVQETVPCPK